MGAPVFPPSGSSRHAQPQQHRDHTIDASSLHAQQELEQQSLEGTYTSLIQEYLQVMCLDNATFLAERMVASCQTTKSYYLLAVCHYRSGAPQRALSVLSKNTHQSSSAGGTNYHNSATAYLIAKCCFDLQQYSRAEEALLEAARADYKEYKNVNRNQGHNYNNKDGNLLMGMDEWLIETSPSPIPNGAAGLYLLGNICRRSNRRRRAIDYFCMSLQVCSHFWLHTLPIYFVQIVSIIIYFCSKDIRNSVLFFWFDLGLQLQFKLHHCRHQPNFLNTDVAGSAHVGKLRGIV